ncbi:MAG: J domain-containing protein [Oligoflexia bacterium]|nr:J domain-containing protein [Oligoflexia bacterium]
MRRIERRTSSKEGIAFIAAELRRDARLLNVDRDTAAFSPGKLCSVQEDLIQKALCPLVAGLANVEQSTADRESHAGSILKIAKTELARVSGMEKLAQQGCEVIEVKNLKAVFQGCADYLGGACPVADLLWTQVSSPFKQYSREGVLIIDAGFWSWLKTEPLQQQAKWSAGQLAEYSLGKNYSGATPDQSLTLAGLKEVVEAYEDSRFKRHLGSGELKRTCFYPIITWSARELAAEFGAAPHYVRMLMQSKAAFHGEAEPARDLDFAAECLKIGKERTSEAVEAAISAPRKSTSKLFPDISAAVITDICSVDDSGILGRLAEKAGSVKKLFEIAAATPWSLPFESPAKGLSWAVDFCSSSPDNLETLKTLSTALGRKKLPSRVKVTGQNSARDFSYLKDVRWEDISSELPSWYHTRATLRVAKKTNGIFVIDGPNERVIVDRKLLSAPEFTQVVLLRGLAILDTLQENHPSPLRFNRVAAGVVEMLVELSSWNRAKVGLDVHKVDKNLGWLATLGAVEESQPGALAEALKALKALPGAIVDAREGLVTHNLFYLFPELARARGLIDWGENMNLELHQQRSRAVISATLPGDCLVNLIAAAVPAERRAQAALASALRSIDHQHLGTALFHIADQPTLSELEALRDVLVIAQYNTDATGGNIERASLRDLQISGDQQPFPVTMLTANYQFDLRSILQHVGINYFSEVIKPLIFGPHVDRDARLAALVGEPVTNENLSKVRLLFGDAAPGDKRALLRPRLAFFSAVGGEAFLTTLARMASPTEFDWAISSCEDIRAELFTLCQANGAVPAPQEIRERGFPVRVAQRFKSMIDANSGPIPAAGTAQAFTKALACLVRSQETYFRELVFDPKPAVIDPNEAAAILGFGFSDAHSAEKAKSAPDRVILTVLSATLVSRRFTSHSDMLAAAVFERAELQSAITQELVGATSSGSQIADLAARYALEIKQGQFLYQYLEPAVASLAAEAGGVFQGSSAARLIELLKHTAPFVPRDSFESPWHRLVELSFSIFSQQLSDARMITSREGLSPAEAEAAATLARSAISNIGQLSALIEPVLETNFVAAYAGWRLIRDHAADFVCYGTSSKLSAKLLATDAAQSAQGLLSDSIFHAATRLADYRRKDAKLYTGLLKAIGTLDPGRAVVLDRLADWFELVETRGTFDLRGKIPPERVDNAWAILGLPPRSNDDSLKRNWRRLSVDLHPDRNPEDRWTAQKLFDRVQQAYGLLKDPQRRKEFELYRPKDAFYYPKTNIFDLPDSSP